MIRQSTRTGRTFSTSSIHREVIQAQGHSGSNQNCMSLRFAAALRFPAALSRTLRTGHGPGIFPSPAQTLHGGRAAGPTGLVTSGHGRLRPGA